MSIEIEIDIKCNDCGRELDAFFTFGTISVEPCPDCMNEKIEEGRQDGYEEGLEEGKTIGLPEIGPG